MCQQIVEPENAVALLGAEITHSEQAAEPAPACAVAWIGEHVRCAVGEHQPHARVITQRQVLFAFGQMCAHHAGDRIAIAQPDPGKPDMGRLHHQLFRVRGSPQEREIRGDGEFKIMHVRTQTFNPLPLWERVAAGGRGVRGIAQLLR